MENQKPLPKRTELRIINPDSTLVKELKRIAKANKRTLSGQAEVFLTYCVKHDIQDEFSNKLNN